MFIGKTAAIGRLGRMARDLSTANRRIAALGLSATVLWYFSDDILHLVLHWLHLLLEVIESLLDHFYIEVLGLPHHSGEVATAYTGLSVALYLLYKLARYGCRLWMKAWAMLLSHCQALRKTAQARWVEDHWRFLATAFGALTLAYWFLF